MMHDLVSFLSNTTRVFYADGSKPLEESLSEVLKTLDVVGLRTTISGLLQSLGFGPETESFATGVVVLLIVLVVIGYAAGPTSPPPSKDDAANAAKADKTKKPDGTAS